MPQTIPSRVVANGFSAITEAVEVPTGLSAEGAQELTAACSISAAALDKCAQYSFAIADRGVEGRTLGLILAELNDVLTKGVETYELVRAKVADSVAPGDLREAWDRELREYIAKAARWLGDVRGMADWLRAAPPRPGPDALPRDAGDRHAKGYVGLDAFLQEFTPASDPR